MRQALAYKRRITQALPAASGFQPLMTLYLTDRTPPEEVARAREAGVVAFKLYPAGATTNSDSGVTDIALCLPTLRAIAQAGAALGVGSINANMCIGYLIAKHVHST